jgi:histidinol phosphatase-like PHP family hydrolase
MKNLGARYDFHTHTIFSDGVLLPAALAREAEVRGADVLGIADHVDASNIEEVISGLLKFYKVHKELVNIQVIPGVEISYIKPDKIIEYCKKARKLGIKLVVVHGESPVEPVYEGTNHAAVSEKGIVDILAHPGNISEEDVILAAKNEVFLELSARNGHKNGNHHVAELARKYGARLLVNTDAHSEKDLLTQEQAYNIAKESGLSDGEALVVVRDNPKELIKRLKI